MIYEGFGPFKELVESGQITDGTIIVVEGSIDYEYTLEIDTSRRKPVYRLNRPPIFSSNARNLLKRERWHIRDPSE